MDEIRKEIKNFITVKTKNCKTIQEVYVIEECAELIKELCKFQRGKGNDEHTVEEMADVIGTILTICEMRGYDYELLKQNIIYKLKRGQERLSKGDN